MELPELVQSATQKMWMEQNAGKENRSDTPEEIRAKLRQTVVAVMAAPHLPELSEEQKLMVLEKIDRLIATETRGSFYNTLNYVANLAPGTPEKPIQLPLVIRKWAGIVKMPKAKREGLQKMPNAKNGRVIRDPKGL